MKVPVEVRCIACPLAFCCANCRRAHERSVHLLRYECPICRYQKFLCNSENLNNEELIRHLVEEHVPLHCGKCDKVFLMMSDFDNIEQCVKHDKINVTINNDNEVTNNIINEEKEIEDRFNVIYEKCSDLVEDFSDNFEALVSINKTNKTATITPIIQKHTAEKSTSEEEIDVDRSVSTPHPKLLKTSKLKRSNTPHVKKFLTRQLAEDKTSENDGNNNNGSKVKLESTEEEEEISGIQPLRESSTSRTPSRVMDDNENKEDMVTTPTSSTQNLKVDVCTTLASAVTTSTPTHPVSCQWGMFPNPGNDSPLSEIEGTGDTGSPGQSSINESSKGEGDSEADKISAKKLKSIIITGGRSRLGSQDSSEKQVTFADSVSSDASSASRTKKVQFAEDTKFEDNKLKRVFRRPKRILTPGPQMRMRRLINPHFQALLNRFETQQAVSRTPVPNRSDQESETTPALTEVQPIPARAINFKDESPSIDANLNVSPGTPGNELFKSCIESPLESNTQMHSAIETFTNNIAGSIQTCLSTALQATDDATEIQFKFVITKKRVSVRRIVDDGKVIDEKSSEFDRQNDKGADNIWRTIARAVKSVFWNRSESKEYEAATPTPFSKAKGSLELHSSASKRKCSDVSDSDASPINHKRYKYARIRGRRPLPRMMTQVTGLKMSHSADQHNLITQVTRAKQQDTLNQSF